MFHRANLLKLLASVLLCQLVRAIGSAFTASSLGNGIFCLKNRLSTPIIGLSSGLDYALYAYGDFPLPFLRKRAGTTENQRGTGYLGIQLGLNTLWSSLFMGKNLLTTLLLRSFCSGLQSFWQYWSLGRFSKIASYLLLPYIVWVSFAMLLNYYIWILNSWLRVLKLLLNLQLLKTSFLSQPSLNSSFFRGYPHLRKKT